MNEADEQAWASKIKEAELQELRRTWKKWETNTTTTHSDHD